MSSELTRLRARVANIKKHGAELETVVVRKAVVSLTAAAQGFAETKGLQLAYFGIPTKLGIAAIAALGEAMLRDRTARRFCGAISDAEVACYAYNASKSRSFVAGGQF